MALRTDMRRCGSGIVSACFTFIGDQHMGNASTDDQPQGSIDRPDESKLRGDALAGSEQKRAVDHTTYEKTRNPDTLLRVDEEEDTLYSDGLEVEDDTAPLGTPRGDEKAR